jgi:hypothetical protein
MARSRDNARTQKVSRHLTRVVAGIVVAGSPFALAGTANAAVAPAATAATTTPSTPSIAPVPSDVWDNIAQCESGGKWNTNTGNGYSGGLQFAPSTWRAHGGKGSPHRASIAEQKRIAKKVLASQGWGAWPSCSKKAGKRK